jgi:hypothetical protein
VTDAAVRGESMPAAERVVTFVVRVVESPGGVHAVVERVRSGRKQRVESIEGIGHVIAAMVFAEDA